MNTPFNKSFCGKSPLNELTTRQEANLPEALKTAIEAKSPTNYGSPLNQTGTFAPTESTGDKKKKEDEVAKKNKGKTKEKFPPCPEGKKRKTK